VRDDRHGPTSWLSLTLTEGKFRQVRKMTAVVGLPTLRLVRVRIGPWHLGDLPPGHVRELTEAEVDFAKKMDN
jgi:23S rRNA pseudouridine2457 synthase